ncbi:hypothetical protein MesoLjLc_22140 [Mesorhizobium sp. L-8-10]|uniref:tail fiber domain-containing protein n=1 Tax=Mesorhizobium sp. L-8-10 TaxID=2744523 RepID=UPI0019254AC3|nr:tail fiber domain-containing protein [Mesorhizobium sp. L-8-10]BCH30284.1 hypothetical protein MesoLjLc_22140 [Mesorhizobium sp. L-8-10]
MGSTTTQGGNKGTASSTNTGSPVWARSMGKPVQPGTAAYNAMNTQLQTGPIQAANDVISNRGIGQTAQNVIGDVMGGVGANNWMNQAAAVFQNPGQIGSGQFNQIYNNAQNVGQIVTANLERFMGQAGKVGQIGQQNHQNVYDRAGQPGAAEQYLSGTAGGLYLGGSPYLDDIIAKGSQDVADQTNQMFAAGGRYGSAAHQGTVADAVVSNASNLRNQNYQAERDRQVQAGGMLENAQQGRLGIQSGAAGGVANVQDRNVGNRMQGTQLGANIANQIAGVQGQNIGNWLQGQNLGLGAAQGAANTQGQNISNRLNAAGQLGGLGQQAMGNQFDAAGLENQGMSNMLNMIGQLSGIQNNKVFDANQQMGLGGAIDNRTQQGLNDLINQWQQTDMSPWARIGSLLTTGTGSAGNWGTQTSTQTQPVNFGGILAALLGAIPKASDRRLKEDIRRVGMLDNGLPVYAYRYKGQATTEIGLMADEVEERHPEAVVDAGSGFKAVHYDLAVG